MFRIRAMIRSSRSVDNALISIRSRVEDVTVTSLNTSSSGIIASTKVGVLIYIILRGLLLYGKDVGGT